MPDAFRITSMVPGLPERVYAAWLDSGAHAAFTGKAAKVDPSIGGKFSVLDGYVHGRTVDLLPGRRIVQTWRTKEFPHAAPDSRLEIQFESAEGATRVTIMHSALPQGLGERYKKTWTDQYFSPMRAYFGRLALAASQPPPPSGAAMASPSPASTAATEPKRATVSRPGSPVKRAAAAPKSSRRPPAPKKKSAHKPRGGTSARAQARSPRTRQTSAARRPGKKSRGR